ncbi:hypothetical protein FO519_007407 [Halicephalobus sp. NKZ332]|nr:hypothetical protein FO519_007407 [Halicephalobus sp. NKZ332]
MNRFAPTRPHQPSEKALRSIFVGNIGYDVTEEELANVFSRAGPVVSFRLVYDRETGKSKGFGFCEFHDQNTANNAIRSMNQYELRGRNLRLDSAVANERMMMAEDFRPPPKPIQQAPQSGGQAATAPGETPYGLAPLAGKTPEAVAKTLSNLSPEMMFKVIQDMKRLAQTNPKRCRHLLDTNPQLSFALLQAQVMMHWLNTDTAFNLLDKNMSQEKMAERAEMSLISAREEERSGPSHGPQSFHPPIPQQEHQFFNTGPQAPFRPQFNPQQGPPPSFRPPIQQQPVQRNPWQQNPQQQRFNVPPANFGGNPFMGMQQQEFGDSFRNYGNMPPNPVPGFPVQRFSLPPQQSAFRNSVTNRPPSPQGFQGSGQSQDQDEVEMINQLLSLTDEQIEALDPEEQGKVRELRNQFGMGSLEMILEDGYDYFMLLYSIFGCSCEMYAMFVVVFRSPKSMREYRWFLALFIWWDFWFDVFLGLMMTPRIISPAPAVVIHGFSALFFPYFGEVVAKIVVGCVVMCSVSMIETEVLCLFYRLSVIQQDKKKHDAFMSWKSMAWFQISGGALALGITIPLVGTLAGEEEIRILLKSYPMVEFASDAFITYLNILNPQFAYVGLAIVVAFAVAEITSFITAFFIIKNLRKNSKKYSTTTYRMHLRLTILLVIQLIIPILTFIIPVITEVIFLLNNTVTSNFTTMVGFVILMSYPLSNCLLLIFYIRPYRQYTLSLLFGKCRIPWKSRNTHNSVTPVSQG